MKRLRNVGKLAAIAFSSLVALGYIYDRAGGHVFPGWFFGAARSPATQEGQSPANSVGDKNSAALLPGSKSTKLLPGSKSKVIAAPAVPAGQNTTQPPTLVSPGKLLPGSKSAVMAPAKVPTPAPTLPATGAPSKPAAKTLLPGSKSLVIAPNSTGQSQGGPTPPAQPAVGQQQQQGTPKRSLLPGSKSPVMVQPPAKAPSAPPGKDAVKLLPGSKADVIVK
jgi:hypothetical protein